MDILALSNLLQQSSDEANELKENQTSYSSSQQQSIITPASFGPPISKLTNTRSEAETDSGVGAIWSPEEIPSATSTSTLENSNDNREEPIYQIYFKQEVGTEDIFLGSDDKTPGSFDCTHVVIKVYFPGSVKDELNLDVKSQSLFVESSNKKLSISLPMEVYEEDGSAEWDSGTNYLTVTLPIKKMFDI